MLKIIDLGSTVPETQEPRVCILDNYHTKTASEEISSFWAKLKQDENKAYLWVIGLTAFEYYGCNNNGDAFTEEELRKSHPTFVDGAHIYLHHVNKDPQKSLGRPIFSHYNENMHRVELVLEIDKKRPQSQQTVERIKNGDLIGVSMGCRVDFDVCSICGNKAKNRKYYCDHAKYNLKKILPDGRQVFVYNPNPKFFDISVVTKPADPGAWSLDKLASTGASEGEVISSAELGEIYTDDQSKFASLDKLSEIIKKVDGKVTDSKDKDGEVNVLEKMDPADLEYPILDFDEMEELDVSPGCLIRAMGSFGAPPSLSEVAYASAKHHMGDDVTRDTISMIMAILPSIINVLRASPAPLHSLAMPVLNDYHGEMDSPEIVVRIKKVVEPVAQGRQLIIKSACTDEEIEKLSAEVQDTLQGMGEAPKSPPPSFHDKPLRARAASGIQSKSSKGPGLYDTFTVQGDDGNEYVTDRASVLKDQNRRSTELMARKGIGAALAAAALGAMLTEKHMHNKLLSAGALTAGALSVWNTKPTETIMSQEGIEIPVSTLFQEKRASKMSSIGTLAGMTIPTALMLDYWVNKKKYDGHPDPTMMMDNTQKKLYGAGEKVEANPVASVAAGGLAGAAATEMVGRAKQSLAGSLKNYGRKRRLLRSVSKAIR